MSEYQWEVVPGSNPLEIALRHITNKNIILGYLLVKRGAFRYVGWSPTILNMTTLEVPVMPLREACRYALANMRLKGWL